ncbi:MAG: ATP-dependent RecD-like DNA helicase [Oscillospiraceae bacterium]|jgi:exodeoxyribonuclease V alpha subunit|nr:ATP-dependent RecD-like DNA helicase [Oscillospiraceae bacterium]
MMNEETTVPQAEDLEELKGVVEALTFRNEESGFTVLDLATAGELVTAVGVLPGVSPGEELRLRGRWTRHPTFGRQFNASFCERTMPTSQGDVLKYLSSGVVRGVGPAMALRIVELFGDETLSILESNPQRLATVKGISRAKADEISESYRQQFSLRQVMLALEHLGMTTSECLRTHKVYGSRAAELIQANPYILCEGGLGIGFERADSIARALPEPPGGAFRVEAGILHVMRRAAGQGHTCVPRRKLPAPAAALLGVAAEEAEAAIDPMLEQRRLIAWDPNENKPEQPGGDVYIFLPWLYTAESSAAQRIDFLRRFPPAETKLNGDPEEIICRMEDRHGLHYDENQRLAMRTALQRGLLILTGGPGTGKTTTLKGILELFNAANLKVALAAPTGRAAKRMQELTGAAAKTIHRLLEVEWTQDDRQTFARNQRNPLEAGAVIIDEISMVDISLFAALLEALPLGCRLVLVGDADQLPPVGAGSVLQDLLRAGELPVVRLQHIFRQAMESMIILNSHRIVRGELPELGAKDRDFFFLERRSAFRAAQTVAELCAKRLPKAYDLNPLRDIQVLCPSRKGECGTARLNELLQEALNPQVGATKREIKLNRRLFREGDKVMQAKNNYDLIWKRPGEAESGQGIYNGDIGIIEKILPPQGIMHIRFDDRVAEYPFDTAEELEHAFAVTVHKSQGNEFPAVVMPVAGVIDMLAYRNLLYTAVTRARRFMILVGSREDVRRMVENHRKALRYTALAGFLAAAQPPAESSAG